MSTLDRQEPASHDELVQLRKQATYKDNAYATLENELFKRNNDLSAMKCTLDDALYKLRNEADRALELETDLSRRSDDLRVERLARQNLETSLHSASERMKAEELKSRHLEMELETYASRTTSQHQEELKHLKHAKAALEVRVRALESQTQVNTHSQLPARLPHLTVESSGSDARIAALESELSKAKCELVEVSQTLLDTQQEVSKLPRLQSKLIDAENGQMMAERLASTEKIRADQIQETLRERDEELEYWKSTAGEKIQLEGKIEELARERDEAVSREGEILWREAMMRKRMEEMEAKEAELAMEREEALDALYRFQLESNSTPNLGVVGDDYTESRAALVGQEPVLQRATSAESRLQDLEELRETAKKDEPPLIIVTPPASPFPASPFIAQVQPVTMSTAEEAAVARLLNAIERLRGERDALRRNIHFAEVEHRMVADALQARLAATESEVHRVTKASQTRQDEIRIGSEVEMQKLKDESDHWQLKANEACDALVVRSAELKACTTEMENTRIQARRSEDSMERLFASHAGDARIALASLIVVQHLQSNLDMMEMENTTLRNQLAEVRDQLFEVRGQSEALVGAVEVKQASSTQEFLREALTACEPHLPEGLQAANDQDNVQAQFSELRVRYCALEQELMDARTELGAAQERHSNQQLSVPVSEDIEAASALNAQLEVLEQRVLRRTEQIGMQQHDIKRLETNLRVAEDTIGELTVEVDTLSRDKACLVEDCAQAREARDEAHRKVEILEVELETSVKEHEELCEAKAALQDARAEIVASDGRIETLVQVIAEFAARSKAVGTELTLTAARLSAIETDFHTPGANRAHGRTEVERLASELETKALTLDATIAEVEVLRCELSLAKDETHRVSLAFESLKHEVQSREKDISGQANHLNAIVEDLQTRLVTSKASEEALSEQLKSAQHVELALSSQLMKLQEDWRAVTLEAEKLSLAATSMKETLEDERLSHSKDLEQARRDFEDRVTKLETKLEEGRVQQMMLQTDHTQLAQELNAKDEELQTRIAHAQDVVAFNESLQNDLQRLKTEHTEETQGLRSRLDKSVIQIQSLHEQLKTAAAAMRNFESDLETSNRRYEAAQVEIRGLEHTLTGARTQLDEHDASIQALQHEKTLLQGEHTRLEAELEKSVTKYQYLEQQVRRSDLDMVRLKKDSEHLRSEVVKLDEAAQTAELSLSFKTVQFEQKLAMMQRELKKQQEHRHCQESIAELNEKNEYLEEMLRMKSVEIEENDDRFIEALKEKKRLNGKIESMTRKVQSLQTKLAAITTTTSPSTGPLLASRPHTPSPPIPQSMPSSGASTRPPTRIPSSPATALRARTPEPSRRPFASRLATPEPPVPILSQTFKSKTPEHAVVLRSAPRVEQPSASHPTSLAAPSTPLSSKSRKRRAPEDFDSPAPLAAQVVVASSLNLTPRHLRRPTSERRSEFTPTRNGSSVPTRAAPTQPSPPRRVTAPLSEMTNSPRGSRTLGLGKPAVASRPPLRSWLSRSRPPTGGIDTRCTSALGVLP